MVFVKQSRNDLLYATNKQGFGHCSYETRWDDLGGVKTTGCVHVELTRSFWIDL